MEARYPEGEPDYATQEGTVAHMVAADCLKRYQAGEVPVDADYLECTPLPGVFVTEEVMSGVNEYLLGIFRVIGGRGNIGKVWVEHKVTAPIGEFLLSGTPDAFYYDDIENRLHIWDFKFGWGIVEAFNNWQLLCYAAGAMWEMGKGNTHPHDMSLHVVQPRPYHPEGPVRSWGLTPDVLQGSVGYILSAISQSRLANPPLKVGRHCRDCKASHGCPALGESIYTAMEYLGKSVPDELEGKDLGVHLTRLRDLHALVKERLDSVEVQALSHITGGCVVPGWVAEPKSVKREWAEGVGVPEVKALGELLGVATVTEKPLTPAQVEKAGVDKGLVDALVSRKKGALGLRPQSPNKTAEKVFSKS